MNVSPKGPIETLAVLGPRRVAYLDFFGSGLAKSALIFAGWGYVLLGVAKATHKFFLLAGTQPSSRRGSTPRGGLNRPGFDGGGDLKDSSDS